MLFYLFVCGFGLSGFDLGAETKTLSRHSHGNAATNSHASRGHAKPPEILDVPKRNSNNLPVQFLKARAVDLKVAAKLPHSLCSDPNSVSILGESEGVKWKCVPSDRSDVFTHAGTPWPSESFSGS